MFSQEIFDKVVELSAQFKEDAVKFTQKLIQTPAISGEERDLTSYGITIN